MTPAETAQLLETLKKLEAWCIQEQPVTPELVEPFQLRCPRCNSVVGSIPSLTGRVVVNTNCEQCRRNRQRYDLTITVDANAGVLPENNKSGIVLTETPV